jgi:hypothetical protein
VLFLLLSEMHLRLVLIPRSQSLVPILELQPLILIPLPLPLLLLILPLAICLLICQPLPLLLPLPSPFSTGLF